MNERIYRTPRTYGAPSGYDTELTHYPSWEGRLAEELLGKALAGGDSPTYDLVERVCTVAAYFVAALEARGWLLPVEDAPGMNKDYGTKRGDPK